jgi:predicted RecB family nuclease
LDLSYNIKLPKALDWIRLVRKEGMNWTLLPEISRPELYPNMNNHKDEPFRRLKTELAHEIKEITQVWNVQTNHRICAHNLNIYSWDNPRCTSSALGIKGVNSKKIDKILEINRSDDIIKPDIILYDKLEWRNIPDNCMEFYLDYETINSNLDVKCKNIYDNFIFMIGVGCVKENKWEFKCFISKNIDNEKEMLYDFWLYIDNVLKENNKTESRFIHWTHAEPTVYNKKLMKYPYLPKKNFLDLYKVFIEEPICINGALDYSLKSIAGSMYKHKLIESCWDSNSKCSNGLEAMLIALNIYNKNDNVTNEIKEIKEIERYNEIDCKVIYEIIYYLRNNN